MQAPYPQLDPPHRVLMGPGPCDVAPSVIAAMGRPTLGHLDPRFLAIMDEIRDMLRAVLKTENPLTIPMSGTGSAGMETCLVNLVEPGDEVVIGVHGYFGKRLVEIAERCGARTTVVEQEWGRATELDALKRAAAGRRIKVLGIVQAETSTGVLQDLAPLRDVADGMGALLLVDAVTSLGGVPVEVDAWGIDALYSVTQKCLSCPPGLAPVTFSSRAQASLDARKRPVQSWYLDLTLIRRYWGTDRVYHHTAPINMLYGLHEALRLCLAEGLETRHERHRRNARALWAGLEAMGLELLVTKSERLPQLTAVRVPDGIDDAAVRSELYNRFALEIGGGLGPLKGKIWRIGLMGAGSSARNVLLCLSALRAALLSQGFRAREDPVAAAQPMLAQS